MRNFGYLLCIAFSLAYCVNASANPVRLRCESLANPLGIDVQRPSFSWQSDSTERNWRQSAYEVLVASRPELLKAGKTDVWDSGRQRSSESTGITYAGPRLESRKRYYWSVRVWSGNGRVSESREEAWWEMGLLNKSDWAAKWIRWQNPRQREDEAAIRWIWVKGEDAQHVAVGTLADFHLDFDLNELPVRAALFLIARGDWKVVVNGHDAGQKVHWNEFDRRDLNGLLQAGRNSIDVFVKCARPEGFPPPPGNSFPAALAALLKIQNADGTLTRFPSGEEWQARLRAEDAWMPATVVGTLGDPAFGGNPGDLPQAAALLRREFSQLKQPARARVYVTALGAYRLFINGKRAGPYVLTPGFTQFDKRVQYQTYDVTALLTHGKNSLAAVLGEGWFASGLTWTAQHFKVLPPTRFLAQLEIEYSDGSREQIVTDEQWKAAESPILHDEIYAGETYDARLEQPGWADADFDDSHWDQAILADPYTGELSAQIDVPPQVVMTLKPERVTPRPDGSYIFDMGQNMVGWAVLRVNGKRGTTVRMRFAEILSPDGSIYTTNLRNADATDSYTLKGDGPENFVPSFTFHGFRYVEVTGYPGTPALNDLSGEVVSSVSGEPTATVTTASDLVNRMWNLGIWGQRGNFLSVPTDCPQRDERLGWMADAAVFWRTGSYNFNTAAFTRKWLRDVRDAQLSNGAFTNVSPNVLGGWGEGAPGWGDAGVIVPWTAWIQYGDRGFIDANWDAMERWMQFIVAANPDFIRKHLVGADFADWLAPDPSTPKDLVDTAYWALIAQMMSEMAHATGRDEAAKKYSDTYESIRAAFQKAYVHPDGVVGSGSQTPYVVALQMKLLPPEMEQTAVQNLVKNIESHNTHLTTGFLGTPYLLFALANHGQIDIAYNLLLNDTYPSWGYMIKKGATTWWERWNGDTGDPAMNSYNHYAFGSVVAWVYQAVAGIDTTSTGPGFHEITIQPHPSAEMTSAKGEYESVYGKIVSDWTMNGGFELNCTIPPNTSAKIFIPAGVGQQVSEGGKKIRVTEREGQRYVQVGSGTYRFKVQ